MTTFPEVTAMKNRGSMAAVERPVWAIVFLDGIAPNLPTTALEALRDGIKRNDPALIQGRTVRPDPILKNQDEPITAGDAITYALWKSGAVNTVGPAEETFALICYEVDVKLGEPASVRYWLNYWDDTPRAEALAALADLVNTALKGR